MVAYYWERATWNLSPKPLIRWSLSSRGQIARWVILLSQEAERKAELAFSTRGLTAYILQDSHGDDWDSAVEKGNEDLLLAVLLPLLPNVISITLYRPSDESYSLGFLGKLPYFPNTALKSLRSVNLQVSGEHGWDLDDFRMLAALPSIRSISAPKLGSGKAYDEYSGTFQNRIQVTSLKLWDCRLDSNVLMEELQGYSELQSFVYADYGTAWGRLRRWDPRERCRTPTERAGFNPLHIRTGLLASAHTLRKLTILSPTQREECFIGALLRFHVLEELYTEWGFLFTSARSREGRRPIFRLVPQSLVRLKLHDSIGRSKSTYTDVIEEVVRTKKGEQVPDVDALPNFKRLVFGGWSLPVSETDIARELKKGCTAIGLSLVFSQYEPRSGD